jgi:hypothetical protein
VKRDNGPVSLELPAYDEAKHWPSWPDMLGREVHAGDVVAVAVTAGRCASLTVGMVRRINRCRADGEPLMSSTYNHDTHEWSTRPHCSVTLVPLVDSVNRFSRWTTRDCTVDPDKMVLCYTDAAGLLAKAKEGK